VRTARRCILKNSGTWPSADTAITAHHRLAALPTLTAPLSQRAATEAPAQPLSGRYLTPYTRTRPTQDQQTENETTVKITKIKASPRETGLPGPKSVCKAEARGSIPLNSTPLGLNL
jgi:hypothetical protein